MPDGLYDYSGINGEYHTQEFLDSVWKYLHTKAMLVAAGLDNMTPTDKFAYHVLQQITLNKAATFERIGKPPE